jgi:uncharacterized protein (DUF342 family)
VNKWLITGLIVVVVLILVGVAYDQGMFDNISGGGIATIIAGLAAPYMAIKNWLSGDRFREKFRQKYDLMHQEEIKHRQDYDKQIQAKEKRLADLQREIELLDTKMEVLELKKKRVEKDVKSMSIEETKREVQNLFGD